MSDFVIENGVLTKYEGKGKKVVIIPEGVTSIGESAFCNRRSLTNIIIPDSVTKIGNFAFSKCSSLTSITIPDSVTEIGDWVFSDCSSLTSVTIPNSVKSIGDRVFSNCSSLTSVTIPDSVTKIGGWAFNGCTGLTSVTIPNGVTKIGDGTFFDCRRLASVMIPDSVKAIGYAAFYGCSSLTYNEYDNGLYLENNSNKFLVLVKAKNESIASCKIHNDTKFIHSHAFYHCIIPDITIPDGVTSIGEYAFAKCSSLTSVTIPNSVKSIGSGVFYWSRSLASITIPDGITSSISKGAFEHCDALKNVTIGNSVTSIDEGAFKDCTALESVTIGIGVTSIGDFAFYGCRSLSNVTIPDSVTSIGRCAFSWCRALTKITISNSTVEITAGAFNNCPAGIRYFLEGSKADKIKFCVDWLAGDRTGCANENVVIKYIKSYRSAVLDIITESNNAEAFSALIELTDFKKINIDELDKYIEKSRGKTEITAALLDYKNKYYSIKKPDECEFDSYDTVFVLKNYSISDLRKIFVLGKTDGGYSINGYKGGDKDVVIPEKVGNKIICSIGEAAFCGCKDITSVTIPTSVTSIGKYAFYECGDLTVYASKGSYAEQYANDNGIKFEIIE